MPQFLCFSDSHFFHAEVAPVPLAFTERMRNKSPLSLPLSLGSFRFLLPLSESPWNLPSDFVPFWAMMKPVLFCAFLIETSLTFTVDRPANVEKSLLHPATFQHQFSGHVSTLFSPISLCLLSQQGQSRLQPDTLLQFFIHALLPTSSSGLSWPAAGAVALKYQGMPMRPLCPDHGLAQHCSCRSSYLLP